MLTAGAVLSSVKLSVAVPVLPAEIGLAGGERVRAVGKAGRGEAPGSGGVGHRRAERGAALLDRDDGIGLDRCP